MNPRLRLHILFWLGYLLFESYIEFAWISSSFASIPPFPRWMMAFKTEAVLLVIKMSLSYFIIYIINNLTGGTKKTILFVLAGVLGITVSIIAYRLLINHFILPTIYLNLAESKPIFHMQRVISSFIDLVFIIGVTVAIDQYRSSQRAMEKEKSLMKGKLEAELKFLRTQTNPHFLFNTLNNIYALARKKSDETADVVMKLSKLLRFMLYESRNSTIPISDELRVLQDYIELERIRYNERLTIYFTKSVDDETQPIAPLILLPFVENAFKHGASEARFNSFIHISVQVQQGHLIFTVENSKDDNGKKEILENIGLSNVRRQLELMYPGHRLEINNESDRFTVILTLNLRQHAAV
jgi:LytS/YehU family sensor histidine kinase